MEKTEVSKNNVTNRILVKFLNLLHLEHPNRTLLLKEIPRQVGRARTMLIQAGINSKEKGEFWCEVISTAPNLDNIMVRADRTKPSYTLFNNKDAKFMKHLKSFGEMAVVAIHEGTKLRSKLDNREKHACLLDMQMIILEICTDS